MSITNTRRRAPIVAALLSVATCAAAQTTAPVIFEGLRHTPIGSATLRLDTSRPALEVHTVDPNGADGVAVDLGKAATSWTAFHAASLDSSQPLAMTWTAIADDQSISTAHMRQDGDRLRLGARFTGATTSTYAVHVYDNGRLVGAVGGVPSSGGILIPIALCRIAEVFDCRFVSNFHNTPELQCGFKFAFPSKASMPIELPNGVRVKGNEVLLLEEVRGGGHYPYLTFDGMTLQTNAGVLTLFSESVR